MSWASLSPGRPEPTSPAMEITHCSPLAASILPEATSATVPAKTVMNIAA
ncbi:Uncharacterised protein [Mycobacteroides abscessus subsp. abscessus]|nr:Uncharacterised protein [Mycobacteroides abscessus subsp. abscessus]